MVARRRLRDRLRRLREAAGYTQRAVAEEMDWSLSKVIRIETGQVAVSTTDLRAMVQHYGVVDRGATAELVELARTARERAWWSVYRGVASPGFLAFLGFESSASVIRNFEPIAVPGLLQTPEYARAILTAADADHVEELVELRLARQDLLTRENGPELHFILDHAVIRRAVGGPVVMRRQLRHILEIAEQPNVTVRVVPWWTGLYSNYQVAYVVLEFPEVEDPDVLYIEEPSGELISPEGALDNSPSAHLESFWNLEQLAPTDLAPVLLHDAITDMANVIGRERPTSLTSLEPPATTTGGDQTTNPPGDEEAV